MDASGQVVDQEKLNVIRKDIQLSMLQYSDDEKTNCLHIACKFGLYDMVKKIVEVCKEVSEYYNS